MNKARTLNLIDIIQLKKDLLWGKHYYGLFEKGKLIDSILFSKYFDNKHLIEIHSIELKTQEFLRQFTNEFAEKKKIRYFIRELDESNQVSDIEFMNQCGFKRYNRKYCFEYNGEDRSPNENTKLGIFCREAEKPDIAKLIDIDMSCQIIDYRDELYKHKKFFKAGLDDISVFVNSANLDQIYAFAFKRDLEHGSTFEFIIHPKQCDIVHECVQAFAEKYIHFEKNSSSFRFIINENQTSLLPELQSQYDLIWSTQMLILEGIPREKLKKPINNLSFSKASARGSYSKI